MPLGFNKVVALYSKIILRKLEATIVNIKNFKFVLMLAVLFSGYLWAEGKSKMIIDVRTQSEWDSGHITKAVHLPLDSFENGIESLIKDKGQPVYLYCRSGNRSGKALKIMQKLGYTNAVNAGGMNEAKQLIE
ncbi:MAG: Thiosulfate sulfurtransferase PspE [Cellvibrionales bacterium UBA7375]|nr:sulfurtransferase [Gammaproteobacteria bacterium]CAI8157963.1 MAG: Thiosulfate sulfurtransferase PspE [Cellvibrionales bacterium UBA7375]